MESFEQYVRREACLSPMEFREMQMLHASPELLQVIMKILREQSEGERVSAIGAEPDRASYVHLGAWKALQRAADWLHNRADLYAHMAAEYGALSIEDQ